jgi:hypothetical protein
VPIEEEEEGVHEVFLTGPKIGQTLLGKTRFLLSGLLKSQFLL